VTFEERQQRILEFCKTPKTSKEIMEEFGLGEQGVYRCMRMLKESGHMVKERDFSRPNNHGARYVSTKKNYVPKGRTKPALSGHTICGVKF